MKGELKLLLSFLEIDHQIYLPLEYNIFLTQNHLKFTSNSSVTTNEKAFCKYQQNHGHQPTHTTAPFWLYCTFHLHVASAMDRRGSFLQPVLNTLLSKSIKCI